MSLYIVRLRKFEKNQDFSKNVMVSRTLLNSANRTTSSTHLKFWKFWKFWKKSKFCKIKIL